MRYPALYIKSIYASHISLYTMRYPAFYSRLCYEASLMVIEDAYGYRSTYNGNRRLPSITIIYLLLSFINLETFIFF
jgi:hypothetical protein